MSPTPPSTTSSSAGGHSPDTHYRVVRKRNRVPLSCGPCRHRKLKCNRTHPCENCVRRGDASSCSYAAPGTRKKNQSQGSSSPDDMQNRIDRLEGLVLSLMTNGAQSAGPTAAHAAISRSASTSGPSTNPTQEQEQDEDDDDDMIKEEDEEQGSDVDSVSNSFGALKVDAEKGKSMYFGDSHWHLVLADIAEVKNYFATHKRELEAQYTKVASASPSTALGGPAFLFGAHMPTTEAELRAGLPGKSAVEKLVSRYFNSLDTAVHIIHYPTFHKQLNAYFQDPSKTSIIWIGLLYSVICLAMQSYSRIGDEPPEWKGRTLDMACDYRKKTVQCLIISDYTKSGEYTIETLVLYVHGEYTSRWDAEVGIWVIVGMIVRLAMRMGYHRDPKHFPGLSAFQREMRRRVWSFVRQADIMFSFQLALPSAIRVGDCDAELPRNIFEDEFGPETNELPPARPVSEPTPLSYTLAKLELAYVFGEIVEEINSLSGRTALYEDVMKKDNKLRDTHAGVAPHLHMRPLDDCLHDPATLIIHRFHIDLLYQKAMCVLHRKYIGRARQNPRYSHSRRACVEAAMEILRHQATLNRESQPGGRLRSMKWVISSLTKHDLLLGAVIVCLDLHYDSVADQYDRQFFSPDQKAEMVEALETSAAIWRESVNSSIEAFKASEILTIMLQKLKSQGIGQISMQINSNGVENRTTNEVFQSFDDNLQPEHSAAMTLGMLSSGGMTPNTAALFGASMPLSPGGTKFQMDMTMGDVGQSTGMTPNYTMDGIPLSLNGAASPFSQVFGSSMIPGGTGMPELPLDWEAWDSYIQNGNTIDPSMQFYNSGQSPFDVANTDLTQEQQVNGAFGDSVFMGANTPGRG